MSGVLFSVATPIGNLDDMTPRAISTLSSVEYILCEDTRVSQKLLNRFDIQKKLIAYHKFNEKQQLEKVLADLEEGKNIALISDAGTPCISDPGRILVNALYECGVKVVPIAGACAISTFLSAVPKESEEYTFAGFLPRTKGEQEKVFSKSKGIDLIFYESPNRLIKTLENINSCRKNAIVAVGRELTKIYEEIKVGTAMELIDYFSKNTLKGEIVAVLYGEKALEAGEEEILSKIKILKEKGYSAKDISIILSSLLDANKNKVYNLALK